MLYFVWRCFSPEYRYSLANLAPSPLFNTYSAFLVVFCTLRAHPPTSPSPSVVRFRLVLPYLHRPDQRPGANSVRREPSPAVRHQQGDQRGQLLQAFRKGMYYYIRCTHRQMCTSIVEPGTMFCGVFIVWPGFIWGYRGGGVDGCFKIREGSARSYPSGAMLCRG